MRLTQNDFLPRSHRKGGEKRKACAWAGAEKRAPRMYSGSSSVRRCRTRTSLSRIGAKWMRARCPYLANRPLTLVRYERGQVFFYTGSLPKVFRWPHRFRGRK
jgi:hypothetical protein